MSGVNADRPWRNVATARPTGQSKIGSSMVRRILVGLGGLIGLFHGWLLVSQLWAGQLADPGLVLRWAVAGGLLTALVGLHRTGRSMVWGRGAIAIWLLAALLHAPAVAGDRIAQESPALPETVTAVLQIAAASVIVGLGLLLIASIGRAGSASPACACGPVLAVAARPDRGLRALSRVPRPPPSRTPFARW